MGAPTYFTEVTGYPDKFVKLGIPVFANQDVPIGKYWKVTDGIRTRAVVVSTFSDYAPEGIYKAFLKSEVKKSRQHLLRLVRLLRFELGLTEERLY